MSIGGTLEFIQSFNNLRSLMLLTAVWRRVSFVNPNRDSPNGYPTVTPTELQPVTLAH